MKLSAWLKQNRISRIDFSRRIGLSPGAVTQLCNSDGAWLSRDTALTIVRETGGAVMPNDFLAHGGLLPEGPTMNHSIAAAIEAFKAGQIVVVSDDDDRENEGDLFVAASLCTPKQMAFIVRHTTGIVCAPMTGENAHRLRLDPMVPVNDAPLGTAFTVTVDVRHGMTTGISAEERTNTVRALANGNVGPAEFVRPGHIFPLIAREGGVLMRSGHTEACVDLCRLAGLPEVGVLAELVNDEGTVMRGPQVEAFAETHGLTRVSIADLIAYRQAREKLVERVKTFSAKSLIGELTGHVYKTPFDTVQHFAFVHGDISGRKAVPVRLHRAEIVQDVIGGGETIARALARIKKEGHGVLVYLRDGAAGVPVNPVGEDETATDWSRTNAWREIGLGAQILRDLGLTSIRLLSSAPLKYVGLDGFGIEIAATEALEG